MKHLLIPDVQAQEGTPTNHLTAAGNLIVDEQPEVIVCIGDFADMPSLSIYDKAGSKSHEGRRYSKDIEAARESMRALLSPMWEFNRQQRKNKKKQYTPRMVMTLGNHENRINRAIEADPTHLESMISTRDLGYEQVGWEVHNFLEVVEIDGISYSHYFTNPDGFTSHAIGGTIQNKLNKLRIPFVQGHQQTFQSGETYTGQGKRLQGLVMGAFYQHDEGYMGPQQNRAHFRGLAVLDDVGPDGYDLRAMSVSNLMNKYL